MNRFFLTIIFLSFVGNNLFAQDEPSIIDEFSNVLSESIDIEVIDINSSIVDIVAIEKQELILEKNQSRINYINSFKNELSILEATIENKNYALLNELKENNMFRHLRYGMDSIKMNDTICIAIKNEYYDSSLKTIKESFEDRVVDHFFEFQFIQENKIQIDPIELYSNDYMRYSNYLLKLIRLTVNQNKDVLGCSFSDYIKFEVAKNITSLESIVSFRYKFLKLCHDKI